MAAILKKLNNSQSDAPGMATTGVKLSYLDDVEALKR